MNTRKHGFTLVELLIVVAIIALIAVVLFPILARSRDTRPNSCQSQLKQIGLGILQYEQDYDETLPLWTSGWASDGKVRYPISWRWQLQPYIKSTQLFECRSHHSPTQGDDGFAVSYEVTECGPIRAAHPVLLQNIVAPATTIMVFEENGDTPQARQSGALWEHDWFEAGWTNILFAGHLGKSNYLFADGHVKSLRPMDTIQGGINRWNVHNEHRVTVRALQKLQAAEANFPAN